MSLAFYLMLYYLLSNQIIISIYRDKINTILQLTYISYFLRFPASQFPSCPSFQTTCTTDPLTELHLVFLIELYNFTRLFVSMVSDFYCALSHKFRTYLFN
jgi:hypothetical protein